MKMLVDANIFLAVILNEPEKKNIIKITNGIDLLAPSTLNFEIGNALSAMKKRNRLNSDQVLLAYDLLKKIPVRLIDIEIRNAVEIAVEKNIYAYDAYYLEVAKRMNLDFLTLDQRLLSVAKELKITVVEVLSESF